MFLKQKNTAGEEEKLDWLQLIRTDNIGPITFYNLVEFYGSAAEALIAIPHLAKKGGRKKPLKIPPRAAIEKELTLLRKNGADIITAAEPDYPLALSACDDAPPVLSILGDRSLLNKACVGIVGARNASINGRKLAATIAEDLGRAGQIIVSGLARGIDTAAHKASLKSGTIAVVAGGVDIIYPEENTELYHEIAKNGLIVAESPVGQKPFAQSFPRRNRIISGLSQGVVVVEATKKSGSLITARMAGEQGRDVFAVPGSPLDPRAQGPNSLLKDGAILVESAEDITRYLSGFNGENGIAEPMQRYIHDIPLAANDEPVPDNAAEQIMGQLSHTRCLIDDVIRASGLSAAAVHAVLLEQDITGTVQRLPGGRVSLINT